MIFCYYFFIICLLNSNCIDLLLLGLILFIGIPLPITGAWTGCVAAYLFGLSKKDTFIGAFFGVAMRVAIITALTNAGVELFGIELNNLKGD